MHLLEFIIMVVEPVVENMHSTGLRGHDYNYIAQYIMATDTAAAQNNENDFDLDMSVNFKSTTVFVYR